MEIIKNSLHKWNKAEVKKIGKDNLKKGKQWEMLPRQLTEIYYTEILKWLKIKN